MSETVVLEEEFDPNYVPTKEEIYEYADFIGMDVTKKEDQELLWIAEEGLKAPLPSEWKPCKTDDDDIYYFNFESGESRWEHPCDEHYKNLFKTEKEKQKQSTKQSLSPIKDKSNKIKEEFDSLFKNEIEQILESDELNKQKTINDIDKLQNEMNNNSSETQGKNDEKNDKKNDEKNDEKKIYLQKLEYEMNKFKKESAQQKDYDIKLFEEKLENEMNIFKKESKQQKDCDIKLFEEKLEQIMKEKEIILQNKYKNSLKELECLNEEKLLKLKETENEIKQIKEIKQTELIEIDNEFNKEKNDILKEQKTQIETLKKNHKQHINEVKNTMQLNIQKQNDALSQSLEAKNQTLQNEYNMKLQRLNIDNEEKLKDEKIKWKKEFEEYKMKHESELKQYINEMEQKKINRLSEKESEMKEIKENMKSTMNKEYQYWKQQKEKYYDQQKDKDIELFQLKHQKEIEELKQSMKQQIIEFEKKVRTQQQIKRDQIRNEYKIKLETEHNHILNEKYNAINKLQCTNMELRNEISQLRNEMKQKQQQQMSDDDEDDDKSTFDDELESLVALEPIDIESKDVNQVTTTTIPLPSNTSEWSEYLQNERNSLDLMRERINVEKKSMRQKQRKLEMLKNEWMKERDKLKLVTNKEQFKSTKNILTKKKHDLDEKVIEMNEKVLEIRDTKKLLNKRESRLETLEIEYLRAQNKHSKNATKVPHPPKYPKEKVIYDDTQSNIHDIQSLHKNIHSLRNASNSTGFEQKLTMNSNSIGHHEYGSVISKYVKHNQHTQRTINHHKSWLKSFQSELQNMSHAINHNNNNKVSRHIKHTTKHTKPKEKNEVVIRVKIDK